MPAVPSRRSHSADLPKLPHRGVSLLRKPDGTIYVRFRRDGRTKDVTLDAQKPALAIAEAMGMADEFERGALDPWRPKREGVTLQEAGDRWRRSDPRLAASTVKKRGEAVSLLTNRLGPNTPIVRVSAEDLEDVLYHKKRAASTLKGYHARFSTLFSWAVERRYLDASPMDDVRKPRKEKRAPRVMTEDQLERLIRRVHADQLTKRAANGAKLTFHPAEWLPDWLRLGFYSGLRPGEIRRLRWRDVDRKRRLLHVRHTEAGRTKTGDERVVPIYAVTDAVLDACAARCQQLVGPDGGPLYEDLDSPVVPGARGGLMNLNMVAARVREYRREAGLPEHVVPYSTRHGYASTLIDAGVSARTVQERLGHADGRMTQNYVALVAEKHAREEGAFSGPAPTPPAGPDVAADVAGAAPPATSELHPVSDHGGECRNGPAVSRRRSRRAATKNALPGVGKGVSQGAEHETRTRDLHHGKVALYQLS